MNLQLRIGNQETGFTIEPDSHWTSMWRIHAPNGTISDMVNLTRAKDAAIAWARPRGLGSTDIVRWNTRETAAEVPCDGESHQGRG